MCSRARARVCVVWRLLLHEFVCVSVASAVGVSVVAALVTILKILKPFEFS